ncbi:MAG TPA: M20/M25/M40 family metallo-hydrolase [Vicinamibacterales bacterium]|jgi:glutamate carboxypeptidase|nr:M20/M25/M40 family metallo-hydrolase [Vicinamibacterales bacterium]
MILRAFAAAALVASSMQISSPVERRIVDSVDADNPGALALLEKAVNINSGSQNLAGVKAVGDLFRAEFDALGFKTTWVDGAAFKRAGHLVAEHPGPGPKILLIGHLDTVFEADSPFQKFQRLDDRTAKGPGIIDMKGGDVIIVYALKALKAVGALDHANVVVVMTGDEEDTGEPQALARQALVDAAKGAKYAIGFEDGPGDPKFAVTARRGTSGWRLEVTGTPAHSSQIFRSDVGYGAIFEMARILDAFRTKLAGEEHLTFNPSVIVGGTTVELDSVTTRGTAFGKTNVVPEKAIVLGDLRPLTKQQLQHARDTMKAALEGALPQTRATLTFEDGYPSLAPSEGNTKLLAMYDQASRDLGFGPVEAVSPDRAGAADVSFVADEVPAIIDGVGLMGHDDHTPGETADLTTLSSQTKRATVLLYRLSQSR